MKQHYASPTYYTEESLDGVREVLKDEKHKLKESSERVIVFLSYMPETKGELMFFKRILQAIYNDEHISYPELEQFLIIAEVVNETIDDLKQRE